MVPKLVTTLKVDSQSRARNWHREIDYVGRMAVRRPTGTVIAKANIGSTVRQFDKETSSAQSNCGMQN